MISSFLALLFVILGVLFMLLASIGLVRMPDTYLRSQVATLAPTLGKIGVLLALAFAFDSPALTGKAVLVVLFLFATAPIAAHLIVRAAYRSQTPLSPKTTVDDYKEASN